MATSKQIKRDGSLSEWEARRKRIAALQRQKATKKGQQKLTYHQKRQQFLDKLYDPW
jgi:hypothetical protein